MNCIIHSTVKGVGPAAMAENLILWHELEWQKKEAQWARHILHELQNPILLQQQIRRDKIEKCPQYFSYKLGGCVPSPVWLLEMFCTVLQKM